MRILTFTTLYPNAAQPAHGVFVEQRLLHLRASGRVEARVVAPVPWFPSAHRAFGRYAAYARVPTAESRNGIEVLHPRYVLTPRSGMTLAPLSLALGARRALARLIGSGFDFDLIDAHYYYPDGVAAAVLASWFKKPLVITARGTDINLIPAFRLPRRMMLWASRRAAASVSVCEALRQEMIAIGIAPGRVRTLRNGVDLQKFVRIEKGAARARLGWGCEPTLLSVGLLVERKGHDILIRALRGLPGWRAVIVGQGELRASLERLAIDLGVSDRVRFAGEVEHGELKYFYSAADALVLCSSREGWANVLLESMACGTPVIAARVWGTPEVVSAPEAGVLMDGRTPEALRRAVAQLMEASPDWTATRRHAERFSWDATTDGQLRLFDQVLGCAA